MSILTGSLTFQLINTVRLYSLGAAYKLGLYQRLFERGVIDGWLDTLNAYLTAQGQSPLTLQSFAARLLELQAEYNRLDIAEDATEHDHFAAWRSPQMEYLLLWNARKLGQYPLLTHKYSSYLRGRVCEYGCGAAPIAEGIRRFYRHRDVTVTCADVPTPAYDYARWRLRNESWVDFTTIEPGNYTPLVGPYDTILCMTVFEHLSRPLATAKHLFDSLAPGGTLVLDYLATDAVGVDTAAGVRERAAVFQYLDERFEGWLDEDSAGPFVLTRAPTYATRPPLSP